MFPEWNRSSQQHILLSLLPELYFRPLITPVYDQTAANVKIIVIIVKT